MATSRWLILAVLAAPLAAFPSEWGIDPDRAKNAVFIVLGLACAVWLVRSWWLRAFLGWAVLSFVVSGAKGWGMAGLLGLFAWALVYHAAAGLTETSWHRLRVAIAAAALIQIAWLGVQALDVDPIFVPEPTEAGVLPPRIPLDGWFGNPMDLSLFLGLALPAAVAVSPWLFLPLAGAIVALGATAGMVGVLVTGLWLALPPAGARAPGWGYRHSAPPEKGTPAPARPRWAVRAAVTVAALVVLTGGLAAYAWSMDTQGPGRRPLIWHQLVGLIQMSPVVGWGPNAIDYRAILITPGTALRWNFGFNEYLQGAAELGLPGLALALGFVGARAWRLRGRWGQAGELLPGLVILIIVAAFSIPFRIGPVALLAAFYLGRLEAVTQEASA